MAKSGPERSAVLELAILGLLKEQELHGYELKKRLSDTLGFASGVSFGSLYPALARLEAAGAVKAVESAPRRGGAIPQTGSLGGELAAFRARASAGRGSRGKKVYGITSEGQARFDALLAADAHPGDDDRLFTLRMLFGRYLTSEVRIGLLERRRLQLVDRLARLGQRQGARDGGDTFASSLIEHDCATVAQDISWLERLISAERVARSGRQAAGTGSAGTGSTGTGGGEQDGGGEPAPTPSGGTSGPIHHGATSAPMHSTEVPQS